jgi:hypothetical protein
MKMQRPETGSLVVPLAVTSFILLLALGFGAWAFAQMLDYKNNVDGHVQRAVAAAKAAEDKVKDAQFVESEKQPFRTYTGPSTYGSVTVRYPKTWSGYVVDTRASSPFVDGYFYPGVVPDLNGQASVFALRVQVVQTQYANALSQVSGYVNQGKAKVSAYKAPKVPSVVGSRVDGQISSNKTGTMILLPLRNMTLKIWTEAPQFQNDFDNNILPNFTFAP